MKLPKAFTDFSVSEYPTIHRFQCNEYITLSICCLWVNELENSKQQKMHTIRGGDTFVTRFSQGGDTIPNPMLDGPSILCRERFSLLIQLDLELTI